MFCNLSYFCSIFTLNMMTIAEFSEKKGVPIPTIYSWIYRNQAEKNGFKVVQIGSVKLIQEIKVKRKAA